MRWDHVGATPRWTWSMSILGSSSSTMPMTMSSTCVPRSSSASTMLRRAASLMPTTLMRHQGDDRDDAADGVVRLRLERRPEDGEVVGHEVGADGHGDDVVQHQRPAGAEADELVEGAAAEARGAAGLRHHGRRLGVRPGRGAEEQAGQQEDERRDAQGPQRDEPEGVVDGGAYVAVGGAEERRDTPSTFCRLSPSRCFLRATPAYLPRLISASTSAGRRTRAAARRR